MANCLFYVGSYTSKEKGGITLCSFDETSETMTVIDTYKAENPSYLTMTEDKRFLYAALENEVTNGEYGGAVAAYRVVKNGRLELINQKSTQGRHPCHVSVGKSGKVLFSANYTEGTVCVDSIDESGIGERLQTIVHKGSSMNQVRQDKAHAHFAQEFDGVGLCVCDLGMDKVMIYGSTDGYKTCTLKMEMSPVAGAGPRHLVYDEKRKLFYVLNELTCDVDMYWSTRKETVLHPRRSNITTDSWEQGVESTCAAIHFSRDKRFVLTSSRGADSITTFRVNEDGTLARMWETKTGGKSPRDFRQTESGRYLFCANQESDLVTAFSFDKENGTLTKLPCELKIPKPVCILT